MPDQFEITGTGALEAGLSAFPKGTHRSKATCTWFPTFPAILLTKASDDTIVMGNLGYFQARRPVTRSCWS